MRKDEVATRDGVWCVGGRNASQEEQLVDIQLARRGDRDLMGLLLTHIPSVISLPPLPPGPCPAVAACPWLSRGPAAASRM